ncbi:MAG: SDR family NAD(P)-dependent oxidoreductase [Legionella sp.]
MVKNDPDHMLDDILNEPLALVGMNCQFPGIDSDVEDVDAFFAMLLKGLSPIKEIPKNRWDVDAYYDADREKADKIVGRKGGFLNNPQLFDASFFKIAAVEAKQMDPQHRLFLEVAVRALNHANIPLDSLKNSNTGVFYGTSAQDYSQLNFKDTIEFNAYTQIGAASSAAAGRLSHFLNLKGPSLAVDTACSSSLAALYLAATALRTRQCPLAIVGGVHLNLCHENFIGLTKANMLSATDKCSSFDASADGFVRSEGCGVVIVKRLSDALKDGDTIHAVLKGIVMNQDGDDGTVLVAPNVKAQIAMHQGVLAQAHLTAGDIDYIEAHGTGTFVGDSVEFNAIEQIHSGQHTQDRPLVIGAIKSILGHSIASSGIASLIKGICALKNETIPPNLNYSIPNKSIDPENIPALFPTEAIRFAKQKDKKRCVQISNFGFSGTNVSAIIGEWTDEPPQVIADTDELNCFVVSANSISSLKHMMANFVPYLKETTSRLSDICYTLVNCRDHYKYRCALRVADKETLIQKIESEEYEVRKVVPQKDGITTVKEANHLYQAYLSGENTRIEPEATRYTKVNLPLYYFDRKSYWHEARKISQNTSQSSTSVLAAEPIAIIGMSCRFPKAADIDAFLTLLEQGEQGMADIPLTRWDNEQYYDPDPNALGKLCVKQLGLMDNIRHFDADFFNVSPREAKYMSPQQRVLLETSYHALEDANLSLDAIKGSKTGVFIGFGTNEYQRVLLSQGLSLEDLNIYYALGNVPNTLSGRIAYVFDFQGPTEAIDTACSSSMTAIHNACLSLQVGECNLALVGGINTILLPDSNVTLSKAKMLSPESRCKTFSDDADGYARSEGCAVLVLKRLSTAIQDKDTILAVIKGSAINNDGKSEGFTVPNGNAQEEVIRTALHKAKLSPADIDYIEAHGTGTPLADPIEMSTLTRIFSASHSQEKPLYVSSVKTNIGHCESASGVAGVIKAVLSLQTHKLFKHLNFKKINPKITLKNTLIPLDTVDWQKDHDVRCVGVSSFGYSGANAHVILQEVPKLEKPIRDLPQRSLLVLSAKNKAALELLLASYQHYLMQTNDEYADICYTAATCRAPFLFRVAIQASSAKDAAAMIQNNEYTIYQAKQGSHPHSLMPKSMDLEQVQSAFQEGESIDWVAFYKSFEVAFAKVKLPLYEFVREEFWGLKEKGKLKDALMPKEWYFQLQWQQQARDKDSDKNPGSHWLLLGAQQWAPYLNADGLPVLLEEDNYSLEQLDGVIFAVGLDASPSLDSESAIDFQKKSIKKLLNLVKELNQKNIKLQLVVLTTHAVAELASGPLNLANSPLIGFVRTLVLELPQFQTLLIDLDTLDPESNAEKIVHEIHYNHGQYYEHFLAYREGKRWVARLKRASLSDKRRSLLGEGRYLITGGCGGLGLVTAQAFLSAGAKELILTSRNVHKPEIKTEIKKIKSAYPGRTVRVVQLDVTNKEDVHHLLVELNQDGLLKGIIHAAGVAIKSPLLEHQDRDVDFLFSGKVQGGWYLHEQSQNIDLDFFVVYSSIASVFGSNKESVYSAANSFLDALIAERHRLGLVGTAIQWGPWGDVGMAKKRAQDPGLKNALINNEQGHVLIKMLINQQVPHVAVISPDYLQFMLDFVPNPQPAFHLHLANELQVVEHTPYHHLSPWLTHYIQLSKDKRLQACKDMVCDLCKGILELPGSDDLDADDGFFDLGFDSLMLTEMATMLKEKLAPTVQVMVNIGFDYPTINKLAHHIESELDAHLIQTSASFPEVKPEQDAIAIIGMSCRFPKAPNLAAFELLLEEGVNGIVDIPMERWDNSLYYDPDVDAPGKSYVNKLGLIDNIKSFDANFFGISPREAKLIDPQQRIFLENCYKAIENANYTPEALQGSLTGVFTGVGPNEYHAHLERNILDEDKLSAYMITGNVVNLIPGRVAYTFDFKGPSISVDTACSSSLVAIHYACQSLKNREIDYALAGGVNVLLRPESNITLSKARALSPDGQCKTFDEHADGYVRSEGCGVIFLKRLSDALRDKDTVLAVIKASAINNDGKTVGLTVPNGKSQEEVMSKALSQAALSSNDISYIEAHGTGTPLGDPIEVHAINKVYGQRRSPDNPLYIGAVKTNIGHLESAAGVASIIKTVLSLQNRKIYNLLHFKQLNPYIHLGDTHLALEKMNWNTSSKRNCAGVNAFGFSGTNAHVILQEFPKIIEKREATAHQTSLLVLSAKSQTSLEYLARGYQQYLEHTADDFGDICFTAAACRTHYAYRLAVAAGDAQEASRLLKAGQFASSHEAKTTLDLGNTPTLKSVLALYMQGKEVDWHSFYQNSESEFIKVSLPNYHFDQTEYWIEKKPTRPSAAAESVHPLLGQMVSLPNQEYLFRQKLDLEHLTYIKENLIFTRVVFPVTAYIESGISAARLILNCHAFCIEQFQNERLLYPIQNQEFQLHVKPKGSERYQINIFAKQEDSWQLCAEMKMDAALKAIPELLDLHALKLVFDRHMDSVQIAAHFKKNSLAYRNEWHVLQESYLQKSRSLSRLSMTKSSQELGYYYHPVLLDGIMQSILLLMPELAHVNCIPFAFKKMSVYKEAPRTVWLHLNQNVSVNELSFDIKLYDNSGFLIAAIEELKLHQAAQSNYEANLHHLYQTHWHPLELHGATSVDITELIVLSSNSGKAKKVLGKLQYQLAQNLNELDSVANKNIVFLYEQSQFNDLVHCCQKLFKQRPNCFLLVTENAFAIHDKDVVNPYHTMAAAFWKSFNNELDLDKNYLIDADSEGSLTELLHYIFTANSYENQFALRDSIFVPRLEKIQLLRRVEELEPSFQPDASYLVTGGTGGLGRALVEYLIQKGAQQIIITSRSACSLELNQLMEQVSKEHVHIKHYQVDASNYQQMEQLIADIEQSTKPLRGVFHLAGIVSDGLLVNLSDEVIHSVLNAKMESALILHQLTKNNQLDQFVLFSSSASVLGARGQANYVAANGFLDGLAHLRHQQGLPALAINWGPFQTIGMSANLGQAMQQRGFTLLPKEDITILDVLLPSQHAQLMVCPINWDVYFKYSPRHVWLSGRAQQARSEHHLLNTIRQQTKQERITLLSHVLREIVVDVLALEDGAQIKLNDGLFALGLDSLMAIEIRNRIHDQLQCPHLNLSIEYFINDPSISKIAQNVDEALNKFIDLEPKTINQAGEIATREVIPLCDFQYAFWMFNRMNCPYNIGIQVQIRGKLNKDLASEAFKAVVEQNSAFWLSFNEDIPIQELRKQGQFELVYQDVSLSDEPMESNLEFQNNLLTEIPLTQQPLIRIYLYKINSDLHEVHIIIPHIIADGLSCDLVFLQFQKFYETMFLGKKLMQTPEQETFLNFVQKNNQLYDANLKEKIDFWRNYNKGFNMLYLGRKYTSYDTDERKYLFHYSLNPRLVAAFIEWHKTKNINVSTGLIAICHLVFYKLVRQKKMPFMLFHSGREGSKYKSIIGTFSEFKRINSTFNEHDRFIDFVKSLEEQQIKTAPYQKCSQVIRNYEHKGFRYAIGYHAMKLWNKLFLKKQFKKTKLNPLLIDYYLEYFSWSKAISNNIDIKYTLNTWFNLNIPLRQPERLRVLVNITPSFFTKTLVDQRFANLSYSYPNHFGSEDRPINSRSLWILFSRNQEGEYFLSINGPLTTHSKDLFASEFNQIVTRLLEQDESILADII